MSNVSLAVRIALQKEAMAKITTSVSGSVAFYSPNLRHICQSNNRAVIDAQWNDHHEFGMQLHSVFLNTKQRLRATKMRDEILVKLPWCILKREQSYFQMALPYKHMKIGQSRRTLNLKKKTLKILKNNDFNGFWLKSMKLTNR